MSKPVIIINVFVDGDTSDVQLDFQRDPGNWLTVRKAMIAARDKLAHDIANQDGCPARSREIPPGTYFDGTLL